MEKLMSAFDFSMEDLSYNQRGQLSPSQAARLKKNTGKNKVVFLITGLGSIALAIYLALPYLQTMSIANADMIRLGGIALLLGISWLFLSGFFEKSNFKISIAEGRVEFISRDSTTNEDDQVIHHTSFYIVVGEKEFIIKSEDYDAFTQGHVYRVFSGQDTYVNLGILSIEYLGPPAT